MSDLLGSTGFMFIALPALFAVVALVILGTGVRDLVRGGRLASQGMPVRGVVRETYVRTYGHNDSRRPHRVETIDFTTSTGQRVRSTPAVADIGMVDRSGEEVVVLYDRDRPDRFIAPKNGRHLSPAKPLIKIAICVAALVFLLFFAGTAAGMSRMLP
ncbi:DUF3592 domain-containing protein [Brachybacterium vulturis]|uniref:DUF3592 domain-containing protein n=1 Tax=Brachybacterium vulturis TaxID=2017484 RepID=UPI00373500FC